MVLSVASKHAFSSAGITISKRRNRLDADIIEALQCLKSLISQEDLMLRPFPSLAEEEVYMTTQICNVRTRKGLPMKSSMTRKGGSLRQSLRRPMRSKTMPGWSCSGVSS
jgi:hypothetical protein